MTNCFRRGRLMGKMRGGKNFFRIPFRASLTVYLAIIRSRLRNLDSVQAEADQLLLLLVQLSRAAAAVPLGVAVRSAPSSSLAAAAELLLLLLFPAHHTETVITGQAGYIVCLS
jgi:hypothetical protein